MKGYVDGFVIVVPKKDLKAYRAMARRFKKIWMKHGALDFKECVGDDLEIGMGIQFPKMARANPGETVVFAYIVFKSKAHRDRVNMLALNDPMMHDPKYTRKPSPFDVRRTAYGGFKVIVES